MSIKSGFNKYDEKDCIIINTDGKVVEYEKDEYIEKDGVKFEWSMYLKKKNDNQTIQHLNLIDYQQKYQFEFKENGDFTATIGEYDYYEWNKKFDKNNDEIYLKFTAIDTKSNDKVIVTYVFIDSLWHLFYFMFLFYK